MLTGPHSESPERPPFLLMADNAPVMLWTSGPDTRRTFFNRPWLDFTGRTMVEELGDGWAAGVHPDDRARCLETCLRAFEAERPFELEHRLRRADGQYRWLLDRGEPRYDADALAGYLGCAIARNRRVRPGNTSASHGVISRRLSPDA